MTQENFVLKYAELARKAGERFGMNPLIILAQAALESDWGASTGAKQRRNFFGITAAGLPNEFWNGDYSVSTNQYKLKFRKYASEQDSFMDFARLIREKYIQAYTASNDYRAYAQAIAYSPYISEVNGDNRENYRKGIISRYETIKELVEKNASSGQQPPQEQV